MDETHPTHTVTAPSAARQKDRKDTMPSGDGPVFGIDLGTSYSRIAWVDGAGHLEVLPNRDGDLCTASAVCFDGKEALVGHDALWAAQVRPDQVADGFKRDMGREAYHRAVCGRQMRPEFLSAIVLRKLKQDAERRIGTPVRHVVIGVPPCFGDRQRKATEDAGAMAGLHVLALINEPTAAAIRYAAAKRPDTAKERTVLVFDLGGGFCHATLLRISADHQFTALATDGDDHLGGMDWDERIINYVAEEFKRQTGGADPRSDPVSLRELARRAEACKRSWGMRPSSQVPVMYAGKRLGIPLDRAKFKEITGDLLAKTRVSLEMLPQIAGITWDQVDVILPVGGASLMAMVWEMLTEVCGKPPVRCLDEGLAVVEGAALYAASLRAGDDLRKEVSAHSLGVVALSRGGRRMVNTTVIPKNTPLPAKVTRTFALASAGLRAIQVRIVEGEAPTPGGCTELGTCRIADLPPGLPKGEPVEVTFELTADGCLHVTGRVRAHAASTDIDRPEGLKDDDIRRLGDDLSGLQIS